MKTLTTHIIIVLLIIIGLSNKANAQGATCATAVSIPLGGCTGVVTISDFTLEVTSPAVTCAVGTFRREAWCSVTVPAGPSQNITVSGCTTTTNADLVIQIISGTCAAERSSTLLRRTAFCAATWSAERSSANALFALAASRPILFRVSFSSILTS